jgi:hypothetical protein
VLSEDGTVLWVVDSGPNRLWKLDLTAPMSGINPVQVRGGMGDAWGVALAVNGDLIVAARNEGDFLRVDPVTEITTPLNTTDVGRPHEIVSLPEPGQILQLAAGLGLLAILGRRGVPVPAERERRYQGSAARAHRSRDREVVHRR